MPPGSEGADAPLSRRELRARRQPDATPPTAPASDAADAETRVLNTAHHSSGATGEQAPAVADVPRRRRRVRRGIVIAVVVLAVAVAWVGARALIVKGDLEAAQQIVNHVQDGGTVEVALPMLGERAASAASVSVDPVWRVAEFVPFAGNNLRAVRLVAETLDVMSNDVGVAAVAEIDSDSDESLIQRLLPVIDGNADRVIALADAVAGVKDAPGLIAQVQTGTLLADQVLQLAAPAFEYGPELLGANGARTYLMVFQNNAESVGLGGSAASQTLIKADNGAIAITNQASSANFTEGVAVDTDVPQSAIDLYTPYLVDHINTSSSRPDFPTMADIVTKFWQRDIANDQIDGVVSIDPIALQYVLAATGPITVATGDTMTDTNAVRLLLSDSYARFTPEETDVFFASVAQEVFTRVSAGDFDVQRMLSSIQAGINGGNILFHSSNDDIQQQLAGERVSGILPTDNEDESLVGVFFRDESASKIDYYMRSNIDLTQTCEGATTRFTTVSTLDLAIDAEAEVALPAYVRSQNLEGGYLTRVYVYGPPGTTVEGVEVAGERVEVVNTDIVDLDRPVAQFTTFLAPGQSATVTANFVGDGDFGPAALRSTPMVQATTGTVTPCGG